MTARPAAAVDLDDEEDLLFYAYRLNLVRTLVGIRCHGNKCEMMVPIAAQRFYCVTCDPRKDVRK